MILEDFSPASGSLNSGDFDISMKMRLQSEHIADDTFKAHSDSTCGKSWRSFSESMRLRRSIRAQHGQSDIANSNSQEQGC